MIRSIKHTGLIKLCEADYVSGIVPRHATYLRYILALLQTAETIDDMSLSGITLHALNGDGQGCWSVEVTGNWRVTFQIKNGEVYNVNYEKHF